MKLHKKIVWIAVVPALLLGLIAFAPWQSLVEHKLIAMLNAKGYRPASLTIDHIGFAGVRVRDVSLGEPPLKLDQMTIGYSPSTLLKGELNDVRIHGLNVNITQDEKGWSIEGLSVMPTPSTTEVSAPFPMNDDVFSALPFKKLLAESTLHVTAKNMSAELALKASLNEVGHNILSVEINDGAIKLPVGTVRIASGGGSLNFDHAAQQWNGTWAMRGVQLPSEMGDFPPFVVATSFTITRDAVHLKGELFNSGGFYNARFSADYSFTNPSASKLFISEAKLPWNGGNIATSNVSIPLAKAAPIDLTLDVQLVEIDTLMQALTGNRATATGKVSGKLPLHISAAGAVTVGKTSLRAMQPPGIISLAPDAIPGDNAQVGMVRDLLKNLHYTELALDLDMAPDNTLNATLVVEGSNPDVEAGRPVKLNVHLSGDLLNFVVQNSKLMTDPKSFIEQNNHE